MGQPDDINQPFVRLLEAIRKDLAEKYGAHLEFHDHAIRFDTRTDAERAGTDPKHALQLVLVWDGELPEFLKHPSERTPVVPEVPDDYEMTDEERALFAALEDSASLDTDPEVERLERDAEYAADSAARDAEEEDLVRKFLGLKRDLDGRTD